MASNENNVHPLASLAELPLKVHLCQLYENLEDFFEASLYLIRAKKSKNQKCLWIYPDEISEDELHKRIEQAQIYTDITELRENLRLVASSDWYQSSSTLSAEELVENKTVELQEFLEKSYCEFCVLTHIPDALNGPHIYNAIWEDFFSKTVPHAPLILMCQYDMKKRSAFDIIDISAIHDYILTKRSGTWCLTSNSVHEEVITELERSRNFYLTLFEEFPALIWRAGLDGLCNYFNKNWLSFTGRSIEQELGNGWAEGVHPEDYDRCVDYYEKNFNARSPFYMEYRLKRFDGEYRWISDMGMPFFDMDHAFAGYIGSCYDITAHREMEDNLRIISKEAQDANLSKTMFLSNMSHEIRTPMNGVIGMLELLTMTELTEIQHDYIDKASTSAHLLLRIINDILDLSKIEAGKLEFEIHSFSLHQIVENILETLRPNAEKKSLVLLSRLDEALPHLLKGDSVRLSQILINLMNNGIKFTDIGRITLCIDLVSETKDDATMLFAIKDTGIGIPETQMGDLFKIFNQLSNAGNRKYGGTGLGLAISKQLVSQMGGELQVESKEDQGSVFYFAIKLEKALPPKQKGGAASVKESDSIAVMSKEHRKRKPRLLIAEDDEINQQILSVFLSDHFILDIVSNGVEAVRLYKESPYDIVLMDVLMPIMNGYDATEAIRSYEASHGVHAPIIGFTAYAMASDGAKCLDAGMDSYISKPIDKKTLLKKLLEYTE